MSATDLPELHLDARRPTDSGRSRGRRRTSLLPWMLLSSYVGMALYLVSPHRDEFPAVVVALFAFSLAPALLAHSRPTARPVISPLNWTVMVFWVTLVVVPLLVCHLGVAQGELPIVPGDKAINAAILVTTAAYCAFCVGFHLAALSTERGARSPLRPWRGALGAIAGIYVGLGLIGALLAFGSPSGLISYFSKPVTSANFGSDVTGSLSYVAGVVLRAFLGFGCVVAWGRWVDAPGRRKSRSLTAVTGLAAIAIVFSYGTFAYNRGAFLAPLVALVAAHGYRVRAVRARSILIAAVVLLLFATGFRAYRSSHLTIGQLVGRSGAQQAVLKSADPNKELQLYGSGPQYLGFLLEKTNYAAHLTYGGTVASGLLFPIPKLGKPFRPTAGVTIFNQLIYGNYQVSDQVVPFTGEAYLDFGLPGVLLGFGALGAVMSRLQRGFMRAPTALQAFAWQYTATWLAFLVVGSVEVVSQVYFYFFWPAVLLAAWFRVSRRPASVRLAA